MSSQPLSQQAYDALYQSLLTNRLRPGDEINRRQVAADLGVGIGPVVEAMLQLEWEGFLEARPRRGTTVKAVTARQVLGWMHLRVAIETQAARMYAGPMIRAAKEKMLALARKLDASARGSEESVHREVAFHRALVDVADSPVLTGMFDHVMRHSLYYAAARVLPKCPTRHPQSHVKLVNGLVGSTPEGADRLIRDHLESWIQLLTQAADNEAAASPRPANGNGGSRLPLENVGKRRPRRSANA